MNVTPKRRPRRRALHDRNPSVEVIDAGHADAAPSCIDLTREDDDIVVTNATTRPVVDLTSVNDSPIVILGTPESPPRRRRRRHMPTTLEESDSDDFLELPPFTIPDVPLRNPQPSTANAPPSNAAGAISPDRTVTCPICLDTSKEIQNNGRQVFSTYCGHVFCNECITDAIRTQKRCPSCRKKLNLKQIHPIFI